MKVICIGSASKDIFFPTDGGVISDTPDDLLSQRKITFELGAKYHIDERYEAVGGCAANVCCGLKKLGIDSTCCSTAGNDLIGQWIINEFEKRGVNSSLIRIEKNCPSDLSAIIVDKRSGERIIFSNQKANAELEIIKEKLGEPEWFFIGDLSGRWENNLDKIMSLANEKKIKVAFNPRQQTIHDNAGKIIEVIGNCAILLLNKDESIEVVSGFKKNISKNDLNDEIFLIKGLKGLGVKIAVITDGKRGAWAFDGKDLFHAPATGNEPLETTGAGDAFSSGFLAAVIKEKSLEEALKWGIANSGNVVEFYGAIDGLLDTEQIISAANNIVVSKISL